MFWRAPLSLTTILAISTALCASAPAQAEKAWAGARIPADVVKIVDGDTLTVRAQIWIGQTVDVKVRLAAVDAPELYRSKCDAEKNSARAARDYLADAAGLRIFLTEIRPDKYGGRVVARTLNLQGEDLGAQLLAVGLAVPHGAPRPWCSLAALN